MNNEELMHYGIPGMKWGHRKPQTGYISKGNAAQTRYLSAKTKYKNARKSGKNVETAKQNYINVKKETSRDRKRRYSTSDKIADINMYGKKAQARIQKHIDKGNSRTVAYGREYARAALTSALAGFTVSEIQCGGAKTKRVISVGKKVVEGYTKRKKVIGIGKNSKFDPIDVAYKIIS